MNILEYQEQLPEPLIRSYLAKVRTDTDLFLTTYEAKIKQCLRENRYPTEADFRQVVDELLGLKVTHARMDDLRLRNNIDPRGAAL